MEYRHLQRFHKQLNSAAHSRRLRSKIKEGVFVLLLRSVCVCHRFSQKARSADSAKPVHAPPISVAHGARPAVKPPGPHGAAQNHSPRPRKGSALKKVETDTAPSMTVLA